jgi:hypothetical protein
MMMIPVLMTLMITPGQMLSFPPEGIQGQPGQFITIKPSSLTGKVVQYVSMDPGLALFPAGLLSDPSVTVGVALQSGTYRVLGYTALGDRPSPPAICSVIVGQPGPPGPPSPPAPVDPLAESIKGIYGGIQDQGKAGKAATLAKAYRAGIPYCSDPSIKTAGDLYLAMKTLTRELSTEDLKPIRERISDELGKVLPMDSSVVLEGLHRKSAADLFLRLSSILEGLR